MKNSIFRLELTFALSLFCATTAGSTVLRVGADYQYKKPSQVMSIAKNGDTIEIQAGIYSADVGIWRADSLLIRGIGGKPHLQADGAYAEQKAIWVVKGKNTTIENIEFSGCSVPDKNGAGIRQEGDNLTLRHCYFNDNEDGVLTGASPTSDMLFEFCEFNHNGYGDGYSHNMYIGHIRSFTIRWCYTHHAVVGHNIKSRAGTNFIMYNRIADEETGNSSMQIDLPNGGFSLVIGNLIIEGPNSSNRNVITYGLEGLTNTDKRLFVVNNTIVSRRSSTTYASLKDGTIAKFINNIFTGSDAESPSFISGVPELVSNLQKTSFKDVLFVDEPNGDFHLLVGSPAIGFGTDPGDVDGKSIMPMYEYVHPLDSISRKSGTNPSAGAFEYYAPVSISDINTTGIDIYPNPIERFCRVGTAYLLTGDYRFRIFDLTGNEQMNQLINCSGTDFITLDFNNILSGCYILSIDGNTKLYRKLIFVCR